MDKRFFWLSFYCRRLPSLLAAKRFDGASKAGCNLNCQSCTQISHSCKWISSQMTKSVSPFAIPTQMSRVLFLATIQSLTQFGPSTVRCEVPDHSSASPASDLAASKHLRHVYCQYLSISILGSTELAVLQCRSGYCTGEVNWKDWRNSVTQQEQRGCPKMGDIQLPRKEKSKCGNGKLFAGLFGDWVQRVHQQLIDVSAGSFQLFAASFGLSRIHSTSTEIIQTEDGTKVLSRPRIWTWFLPFTCNPLW